MSRKSSLLLVISLTIAKIIICQEPSRICTCDLSPKYCDINCCCDSDCSESDLRIFPKCSVESTDVNSASLKYCTNAAQLIFKNVNYRSNSKNGLLCIYKDNYKEKLNFINTDPITTEEKFLEIKSLYGSLNSELLDSFHYDLADDYNLRSILPQSQYNVGNDILALTNNGILLKFPMPEGLLSEFCNYNALPKYFVDKQTVCLHSLHDIDTKCEVDPVLSAEWYYNRFSIVTTPKYLTSSAKESDQKFTTKIISNLPNFPSPKFNSTNRTCDNVVTAASYHFFINDNLDISNVTVDINLQSVPTLNKFFRRNFAISFTWLKAKEIVFKRSGNPGYKVGEPILAGERTVNGSEFTGVQLNADRNDWLTVMQSTGNGLCNSTKTVPIRFGENIITGCLMELTSAASAAECKSQQQLILERMKGSYRDVVGAYGNSSVEFDSDWVPILVENFPTNTDNVGGENGLCGSMTLGLDTEILHVSTGSFMDPQAKIIGVRHRYRPPQPISSGCSGPNCDSDRTRTQRIPVTVTVSFIDVSDVAQPAVAAIPVIDAKLPNDFFYPFTGSHGIKPKLSHFFMIFTSYIADRLIKATAH